MVNFLKTNPVRAMAIVNALIVFAVAFGLHLSTQQIVAIGGLASVVLGLGGELVRANVTPMATLPDHVAAAVNATMDAEVPKRAIVLPIAAVIPATTVLPTTSTVVVSADVAIPHITIKENK